MKWAVVFTKESKKDYEHLDGSQKKLTATAIKKVSQNPLPTSEGGYGKPLGHHASGNLSGLLKVKLKHAGLRIVYKLEQQKGKMVIIVIGIRDDEQVYKTAAKRLKLH